MCSGRLAAPPLFGTNTVFVGSILANISDTVTTGASVIGRVFALTGAVTLSDNQIRAASK
jgi:hypothetical protein